jgi:diguanylate cyclase (GGDEF)-like protein
MTTYLTKRCIFEGQWSQVFLATEEEQGKDVVIKQLRELFPQAKSQARFAREFEITRSANGPHVIGAYEMLVEEGTVGIVLEDFGARSVAEHFKRTGRLTAKEALPLAVQVADGLSHIHQRNIVHKDINPANVVWNTSTGVAKLIDFGISQVISRVTPARGFSGTPAYMSPEQTGRMNRDVDCRSDLYSFGVMLYELLTGRKPFESDDPLELVHSHIARSPVPPSEYGVDKHLSDIVMILLSKRAEDRYTGAAGLSYDLAACLESLKSGERIEPFALRQRDADERLQIPQKLYGRESETATLLSTFDRVASGAVEVLLVSGYSGVGKTSLVHEVHPAMTACRGIFVEGKFDQLNRGTPYDSLIQAFRSFMREVLTGTEAEIAAWREALLSAVGQNGQILIDVIPETEHVIGPQPEPEVLEPAEARNRFQMVIGRFLRAVGSADHPLVLFLDDLQWADLPTLDLIGRLATDPSTSHVLFIGAFRDNAVSPSHPLMSTIEEMSIDGVKVETIELGPLTEEDVLQLLRDTLDEAPGHLRLALTCHAKTHGNAFFLNRFLESLHDRELLLYDRSAQHWVWDLEAIQTEAVTDNVVEFMAQEIRKLEPQSGRSLQLAACIGNTFDLGTLAFALEMTRKETLGSLKGALEAELILVPDETFWYAEQVTEETTNFHYRFAHDRVQQAAYAMLPEGEAAGIHLRIGRHLLKHIKDGSEVFSVVEHLNRGAALVEADAERARLVELNLKAGRRATWSAAFESAHEYFVQAQKLLEEERWDSTALAVYLEGARAAYLAGHYELMERRVDVVLERELSLLDRVSAQEVRIQAFVSQEKLTSAIKLALQALKELGVEVDSDPQPEQVEAAIGATLAMLEGRDLSNLPEVTDPEVIAAQRIQSGLMSSAYLAQPSLLPILCCSMVQATLKHGVCRPAIYGFTCLGLALVTVNQIDLAYGLGQSALKMIERYDDRAIRVKNVHVVGSLINAFVDPLRSTLEVNRRVCRLGLNTGDLEYAGWGLHTEVANAFWAGLNLDTLAETTKHHVALLEHHKQGPALACTYQFAQAIENFTEGAENPTLLIGPNYDEMVHREKLTQKQFRGAIFVLGSVATLTRFYFRDLEAALESVESSGEFSDSATATYHVVIYHQYRAMTLLGLSGSHPKEIAKTLAEIEPNLNFLETLHNFSVNFEHRVSLIRAEIARLEGRKGDALELYERAIEAARDNEYIHEQALANELAGRFLLSIGSKTPARGYLMEAIFVYTRWGGRAKARQLEGEFAELLAGFRQLRTTGTFGSTSSTETGSLTSSALDVTAILRASQAISKEIVLGELVRSLTRLALEVGGAQRGLLILFSEGRWEVVCQGAVGQELELRSLSEPLEEYPHCPAKLIQYVIRTRQDIILSEASTDELFAEDDYIKSRGTRSVLCLAVKQKNQVNAVLYLENDLTTAAFTRQQFDLLRMLVGQAAISIENAQLYNTLERRVEDRTRELKQEIQERIRAQEKLRILATTDSLTGASNRRRFLELSEQEYKRVRRYPSPLTAIMLDADHFKQINDTYGHDVGDQVLRALSHEVAEQLRTSEIFGRIGGEEFAVALPATGLDGAKVVGERIREAIAALQVKVGELEVRFTISLGAAELNAEDGSFADLLKRADEALYRAKESGRNCLVLA